MQIVCFLVDHLHKYLGSPGSSCVGYTLPKVSAGHRLIFGEQFVGHYLKRLQGIQGISRRILSVLSEVSVFILFKLPYKVLVGKRQWAIDR